MGTIVNVVAIVAGSLVGVAVGSRLSARTSSTVTDVLGLVTVVIGALSLQPLPGGPLVAAVPGGAALLVVLLGLLAGAVTGSALRLEDRMEHLGEWTRRRLGAGEESPFVEGFVSASLLFCVGPLAILGSFSDGLGRGAQQLYVKAALDGFASIAFASTLGIGVMAAALPLAAYQGTLTLVGYLAGGVLPSAQVEALSVAGGIILLGLGLRLLGLRPVRVADLLPGLVFAPLFSWVAGWLR